MSLGKGISPFFRGGRRIILPATTLPPTTTPLGGWLLDKDGNEYNSIIVGNWEIIVENLRTTHYADGSSILNLTVDLGWSLDTLGAYCWYSNNIGNKEIYGALYNWFAVNNINNLVYFERGGVPELDWRVLTKTDIDALVTYLGGILVAGGKLKEIGLAHWTTPNVGATDEIGFKLLPAGMRSYNGAFSELHTIGRLYTSTENPPYTAYRIDVGYNSAAIDIQVLVKNGGCSIRCIRDINITTTGF